MQNVYRESVDITKNLTDQNNEMDREIKSLNDQLDEQKLNEKWQQKLEVNEGQWSKKLSQQIERYQKQQTSVKQLENEKRELEKVLAVYKQDFLSNNEMIDNMQMEILDKQSLLETKEADSRAKIVALEEKLSLKEQTVDQLKRNLKELERLNVNLQKDKSEHNQELTKQIKKLEASSQQEQAKFKAQIEVISKESQARVVQETQKNLALSKEKSRLESLVQRLERDQEQLKQELTREKQTLQKSSKQISSYKVQGNQWNELREQYEQQIQVLEKSYNDIKKQLDDEVQGHLKQKEVFEQRLKETMDQVKINEANAQQVRNDFERNESS